MANTYKTDGEKIRELQGLQNQQQIAELAGISRNTYKKALDGGPSTLETLQKLARVFEVDVEELIVRQDSEPMIPFMAPELTSRFVQRPAESEKLVSQILKADHDHPIAITTAVVGTAGFGKTTLAMALCDDERIKQEYSDGILWVTLGENPNIVGALNSLYFGLTGEVSSFDDSAGAAASLKNALEHRRCLLVIDDVWDAAHLRPFLIEGRQCARLFTTRKLAIPTSIEADTIDVGEMKPLEAQALLAHATGVKAADRRIRSLAKRLGNWALPLELANSRIRKRLVRGENIDKALTLINQALDKGDIDALDLAGDSGRNAAISTTLRVSLDQLSSRDRSAYKKLAVFPEDARIPFKSLATLWGLGDSDTSNLVERLADDSLIHVDVKEEEIWLHDLVRQYLVAKLPKKKSKREMIGEDVFRVFRLKTDETPADFVARMKYSLNECFGDFSAWPLSLQNAFHETREPRLRIFLADVHDKENRFADGVEIMKDLLQRLTPIEALRLGIHVDYARFLEHLEEYDRSLGVLDEFVDQIDQLDPAARKPYDDAYWWAKYLIGIIRARLNRFAASVAVLEEVRDNAPRLMHQISAVHQLGVVDLELGEFHEARAKFKKCIYKRGDDKWNYRRAYAHRRLGQIFALENHIEDARIAFHNSSEISKRCGHQRYVDETNWDVTAFIDEPERLLRDTPQCVSLANLKKRFPEHRSPEVQIAHIFRVLKERRHYYLEILHDETAEPTDLAATEDTIHQDGLRHGTVALLLYDPRKHFLVQRRHEKPSFRLWDISVAGHIDIGEKAERTAVREAYEEVGVLLDANKLIQLGEDREFRKEGRPDVERDEHLTSSSYVYKTKGRINRECITAYIAEVQTRGMAELESRRTVPGLETKWMTALQAHAATQKSPIQYASSFKQFFGNRELLNRIRCLSGDIKSGRIAGSRRLTPRKKK